MERYEMESIKTLEFTANISSSTLKKHITGTQTPAKPSRSFTKFCSMPAGSDVYGYFSHEYTISRFPLQSTFNN